MSSICFRALGHEVEKRPLVVRRQNLLYEAGDVGTSVDARLAQPAAQSRRSVALMSLHAVSDGGQIGNEICLVLSREPELEFGVEVSDHLLVGIVAPIVK
jgi:hypothetical protein